MFDIGLSEMLMIAVIALVVLGPERLPRVARQVGQWTGKLQRYVTEVKSDINRQMELEELRRLKTQVQDAAQSIESSVQEAVSGAQSELQSIGAEVGLNEAPTDWDAVYAVRRARDRIKDRRIEREKLLGRKRPRRNVYR
ncbi:MAG: twin-arginine translocase subunit TatB [Betaproteobacteria bacterium]|jgi:sec-independent protein translocase protein TatB|nr:Sec-independent protein translocase protein TatB [Pseudomonadota bacterium]NBO04416.1 twin-arginine translocase subunit TatB [Betaproteobacteria bacterium]HAB46920.1 twin-arginine translocase subunit TatB [Lautropia sp.]NBP34276.1 twin-arginine translocase subunit TatB [Betaproteobacteria bacterium]NBP37923.1 twin-arginine translocase subunit TatB [Betaproteobacteria bacterium]